MKYPLLTLFLAVGLFSRATETINFDMYLFGDKVGSLTFTRTQKPDGSIYYELNSHIKAKILWITRENSAHMETTYKNGKLINCYQKEVEDGKVKRWNRVTFDGTKYVQEGYKGKTTFTRAPDISVATIYFDKPLSVQNFFYEPEAEFVTLEKVDENTYEFKGSDGARNVYHYKDGKSTGMEFHVSIATVKLVRTTP